MHLKRITFLYKYIIYYQICNLSLQSQNEYYNYLFKSKNQIYTQIIKKQNLPMKKISLVLSLLLSVIFTNVYGQDNNVKLTVKLNPVVSLTVNDAQKDVLIAFTTVDDYRNGKESEKQENHLNAFSVGPYKISAKASTSALTSSGSETIDLAKIQITAESTGETAQTTNLTSAGSILFQSDENAFDKSIDVTYKALAPTEDFYLKKHFNGSSASIYTTNVEYTIEVK